MSLHEYVTEIFMRVCPHCGSELQPGADYCLVCGAAIERRKTNIPTVTLYVSSKEARQGCTSTLRYPGGPKPMRVNLPKKMYDGMVLYVNEAKFYVNYGEIVKGPLRIVIRVQKEQPKAWPLAALSVLAGILLAFLIFNETSKASKKAEVVVTEAPVIAETTPIPVPTETPAIAN